MGLFAPWFLAGLVGLGLPVYLHLLKRQKNPPRPVPSLMFWESRTQASTRHRRLNYLLLLSLRLALLFLLIFAFANPFINRSAAALASNRLVLIVVDNSFSMRAGTRLADAKTSAMNVLSGIGGVRAQVASFGSQLHILTQAIEDQGALRAAVQSIEPGDGHGTFGELARAIRGIAESARTPVEVQLFSDMQRTDLPGTFADMTLPANVKLVTHAVVTKAQPNWTVETVDAPGQVWGKDLKPIHVSARDSRLRNSGGPTHGVAGGQRQDHRRQNRGSPRGRQGHGRIPCPGRPLRLQSVRGQDRFGRRLPRRRSAALCGGALDPQKVLLVHNYGDTKSQLYFGAALAAAAQSAFTIEPINANEAADRNASNYAL